MREFPETLAGRAHRWDDVFSDEILMDVLLKGLNSNICRSIRQYWLTHKSITMKALIKYGVGVDTAANQKNPTAIRAIPLVVAVPLPCECPVLHRQ